MCLDPGRIPGTQSVSGHLSDSHRSRQTFLDSAVSIFTLRVCTSLGQTCCPPLTGHSSSQWLPDGAPVSSLQLSHPWTPGESQSCPPTCFGSVWPLGQNRGEGLSHSLTRLLSRHFPGFGPLSFSCSDLGTNPCQLMTLLRPPRPRPWVWDTRELEALRPAPALRPLDYGISPTQRPGPIPLLPSF